MDEKTKPDRRVPGFFARIAPRSSARLRTQDPQCRLIVPAALLRVTLEGLRDRSAGWRESAAVWAGTVRDELDWEAAEVFFHHELCDDHGGPLSLGLTEDAKVYLYRELAARELRPVALLHTHPSAWVGLSEVDQANQVSSRIGFWSIVVPHYGREPWVLTDIGFHVRAARGWHRVSRRYVGRRVMIRE